MNELTYKIIAFNEIPTVNTDECVEWATKMLEDGYDSDNLLILAGLTKPLNYFEVMDYLKKALKELHLREKTGIEAIISYSYYYINKIAKGEEVRDNLTHIYHFCQDHDYEDSIYDFYLFYWAWDDLDYQNDNHYWPSATKNNIKDKVISKAQEWVKKNKIKVELN